MKRTRFIKLLSGRRRRGRLRHARSRPEKSRPSVFLVGATPEVAGRLVAAFVARLQEK